MLHKETVTQEMWELLQRLMKDENLKDFNLVGGTALSLMIGHRLSIDIDLFTTKGFNEQKLLAHLTKEYPAMVKVNDLLKNTMLLTIGQVKVDILAHEYAWQQPVETKEGVRLASLHDIGAMKLHAIFQNGTRIKDFVDMHFMVEHHPLKTYLEAYEKKYGGNPALAAYGLLHHNNIDMEEKVKLVKGKGTDWKKITERLQKAVVNPSLKFPGNNNDQTPPKGRGFRR